MCSNKTVLHECQHTSTFHSVIVNVMDAHPNSDHHVIAELKLKKYVFQEERETCRLVLDWLSHVTLNLIV